MQAGGEAGVFPVPGHPGPRRRGGLPVPVHPDVEEVLLTAEEIAEGVQRLAREIAPVYRDCDPVFVCILKGGFVFLADLIRYLDFPVTIDFMAISSYGGGARSSGVVRILKDLDLSIEGRHVLIVEDIVDSGLSLSYLKKNLKARQPASLRVCTLLDKPGGREADIVPDFCGFRIPNKFVVGYGLDYGERYRNLPYIGVLKAPVFDG